MAKYAKCISTKEPSEYTVGRLYKVLPTTYTFADFAVKTDTGHPVFQKWERDTENVWEEVSITHAAADIHNNQYPTLDQRKANMASAALATPTEQPKQETKTMKIVSVKFNNAYSQEKSYAYMTDIDDIAVNDLVVVESPSRGLTIVEVVSVQETAEGIEKATKWVVDKIDVTAHKKRLADIEQRKLIVAKLKRMQADMLEADQFAMLAANNPEAAALIDQLRALA